MKDALLDIQADMQKQFAVTTYGLIQNEYSGDFIKVISLDDLF